MVTVMIVMLIGATLVVLAVLIVLVTTKAHKIKAAHSARDLHEHELVEECLENADHLVDLARLPVVHTSPRTRQLAGISRT